MGPAAPHDGALGCIAHDKCAFGALPVAVVTTHRAGKRFNHRMCARRAEAGSPHDAPARPVVLRLLEDWVLRGARADEGDPTARNAPAAHNRARPTPTSARPRGVTEASLEAAAGGAAKDATAAKHNARRAAARKDHIVVAAGRDKLLLLLLLRRERRSAPCCAKQPAAPPLRRLARLRRENRNVARAARGRHVRDDGEGDLPTEELEAGPLARRP